jgi:hypothetical protein
MSVAATVLHASRVEEEQPQECVVEMYLHILIIFLEVWRGGGVKPSFDKSKSIAENMASEGPLTFRCLAGVLF